jgi:hypothetical protein
MQRYKKISYQDILGPSYLCLITCKIFLKHLLFQVPHRADQGLNVTFVSVPQLLEALHYKLEGHGFGSQ